MEILEKLCETNLSYKGVRVNVFGIPKLNQKQRNTFDSAMWRLNKNGFVKNRDGDWSITNSGKIYLSRKNKLEFKKFSSPFEKRSPRNLLLMFDVPESKKVERGWLRWQLKEFNYIMVQKSVWVGPSPLPKEFKEYVKELNLDNCIKIFKLAKNYQVKK